jgi:hypothetical protein
MVEKFSVTREIHEWKTLERPRIKGKSPCPVCRAKTAWLMPEETMAIAGVTLRQIFRLIESRQIHSAENNDGFLVVCALSLTSYTENKPGFG